MRQKSKAAALRRNFSTTLLVLIALLYLPGACIAQANGAERTFPQSKATIEQALKTMQNATSGRLPVLDGFASVADHPLDQYKRGYYQSKIQVSSTPAGGSIVRVSVEVTAWFNDPSATHSGYQLLPSNGRLEGDLLDQLADQLASTSTQAAAPQPAEPVTRTPLHSQPPAIAVRTPVPSQPPTIAVAKTPPPPTVAKSTAPEHTAVAATAPASRPAEPTANTGSDISAPMPRIPEATGGLSSSLAQTLSDQQKSGSGPATKVGPDQNSLQAEADSLEEIVKNQAVPKNLVAVKKDGTAVVATPSLTAKTLFLASAHDEFEMLDFNRDWVHVRISGLSRGWIWRNDLELPDSVPEGDVVPSGAGVPVAADLFRVSREEEAIFPGDWPPLRGKTVKIISVEKVNDDNKDTGPRLRLEFAKSVLDKSYSELAQKPQDLGGIVLIFDSADGGMIAAAMPTLQQGRAGTLSDAALWHQCFFDPPESFTASSAAGTQ
ncbi:MAG: hypothetical protein WBD59_03930, partial [Candidatus Sulfotelmatobacter sp.]